MRTEVVPERRSIGKNFFHLLASQGVTWIIATFLAIIQPRYLGPAAQGQLRLAFSLWAIGQTVMVFGTATHLTLEIARDREHGLGEIGPVVIIRAAGFVLAWLMVAGYSVATGAPKDLVIAFAVLGLSSLVTIMGYVGRAVFHGMEQMAYPAAADVISKLINLLCVVAVLLAGYGLIAVVLVDLLASTVNFLVTTGFLRRVRMPKLRLDPGAARRLVPFLVAFFIADAVLIVYQQVDTVVMSLLVDEDTLGFYSTADVLFGSLLFVPTILMTALFPVLARVHHQDPGEVKRMMVNTFGSLTLAAIPIGLGTIVLAEPLTVLLYGEQYRPTGQVLQVLGVVIILVFGTTLIGRYAVAIGKQTMWNVLMAVGIVLSIMLDLVLVPWTEHRYGNGAIAGAMAYVVTESMMLVIGVKRLLPEVLRRDTLLRTFKLLVAGALMVAATWPLRDEFILIPVVVGVLAYAVPVLLLRVLTVEERKALNRLTWWIKGKIGRTPQPDGAA